jgi:LmbE family N-acetylglucosaminyl deacetylase
MPDRKPWIYLSPHFDDVALSCGGLVWEQAQAGEVEVWTVCAGLPTGNRISSFAAGLHERWEGISGSAGGTSEQTGAEIVRVRRREDEAACRIMGARQRLLDIPDCIYRAAPGEPGQALYASEQALFGPLHPQENGLVNQLAELLARTLSRQAGIVCPLALGNHVDHQLVRRAAEATGRQLWYYADYPYVDPPGVGGLASRFQVSETGLEKWVEAVSAYSSQISTFWQSRETMRADLLAYGAEGVQLWCNATVIN